MCYNGKGDRRTIEVNHGFKRFHLKSTRKTKVEWGLVSLDSCQSLPTTHHHHIEYKKPTLLGRLPVIYEVPYTEPYLVLE